MILSIQQITAVKNCGGGNSKHMSFVTSMIQASDYFAYNLIKMSLVITGVISKMHTRMMQRLLQAINFK